ncbi:MAG: hypothetical protein HS111_31120 [Kofleriaceae bacterium]|nr:hypothetical protein [Kofleriaceae bacterium]
MDGAGAFLGQAAPARLTAWKGCAGCARRWRGPGSTSCWPRLEVAPVVAALVRRTPLTLLPDREPGGATPALGGRGLPSCATPSWRGRWPTPRSAREDPRAQVAVLARLAAAFEQMLERTPPAADVRAVAAFLVHLAGLLAMAEAHRHLAVGPQPAPVGGAGRRAGAPAARAPAATFRRLLRRRWPVVARALATPPGLVAEPAWQRRWQAFATQVMELVGAPLVDSLAARLARHLGAT